MFSKSLYNPGLSKNKSSLDVDRSNYMGLHLLSDDRNELKIKQLLKRFPLFSFTLNRIGIDQENFIADLAPTFDALPWDNYLHRFEQIECLKTLSPSHTQQLAMFFPDYYNGSRPLSDISDVLANLSADQLKSFHAIKPYRKRSISKFVLNRLGNGKGWNIHRIDSGTFIQETPDFRCLERTFHEASTEVTEHSEFKKLLCSISFFVDSIYTDIKNIEITVHQTAIVSELGRPASNSPEGVHQDGFDFIISALVVERKNISGGISKVFGNDKQTELLTEQLEAGSGIFQADKGSPYWHEVSPINAIENGKDGIRKTFGFDISVIE